MPYCRNCGEEISDGVRFCSACGKPQAEGQETLSPTNHLGLDDVPTWLGWLSLPVGVLTSILGLGLYSWWAYRRGRCDGIVREPTDQPYTNIGWRIVGWGLFALIPIAGWYAVVHVPTLCYQHGLRIGAKTRDAPTAFTSLPAFGAAFTALAASVLTVAVIVGVALEPEEENGTGSSSPSRDAPIRSEPVDTSPRLTGGEAAGKANNYIRRGLSESGRTGISFACDAEDYNNATSDWIVLCVLRGSGGSSDLRLRVSDVTGFVSMIR